MQYLPPMALTGVRFAVTAGLLLPLLLLQKIEWPTRHQWRYCIELGLVLGVAHFSLMYMGLNLGLPVASATVVAQMGVPFACLLGAWLDKDRLGKWRSFGLAVAFIGVVMIAGTPDVTAATSGFFAMLAGAFAFGFASVRMKKLGKLHIFSYLACMSLVAVPPLFVLSALFEQADYGVLLEAPMGLVGSLAFTVLLSTLVGHGLWYTLLHRHKVSQVTPFALLVPAFGMACGAWYYGEQLSSGLLLGAGVTLLGVAVITIRRPKLLQFGRGE